MKRKVLIIGASGMLGHMVYNYLKNKDEYELCTSVYKNVLNEESHICDVRNKDELEEMLMFIKPNIVVNCIGALIKQSKKDPISTIYLNSLLPHILKAECDNLDAKLIHISTDCVFSGKLGNYSENDFRDSDDLYGRSKALGEINDSNHLTLRTSIIGPELKKGGEGLFEWFMSQKNEINGFTNAFWSGVTTLELAKAIYKAIENDLTGIIHVTNGYKISKYDLLNLINEIYRGSELIIKENPEYVIDKSLKKSKQFDFKVPSYENMLLNQKQFYT